METIHLQSTEKTPEVLLDPSGLIRITGRSIHEDPDKYFAPLTEWIEEYCQHPQDITRVEIAMEYFNSSSAKYILNMLQMLTGLLDKGLQVQINWVYEEGDDDILERGQYYSSVLQVPFKYKETD